MRTTPDFCCAYSWLEVGGAGALVVAVAVAVAVAVTVAAGAGDDGLVLAGWPEPVPSMDVAHAVSNAHPTIIADRAPDRDQHRQMHRQGQQRVPDQRDLCQPANWTTMAALAPFTASEGAGADSFNAGSGCTGGADFVNLDLTEAATAWTTENPYTATPAPYANGGGGRVLQAPVGD